ncbi:histidine kinase [Mycetocola sp. JXN-3]|uniref:histidine kinase n=1 Tax=Mycetocola sp. JXN-3 TaxID=2116510 RepID=UPI00165D21DE|nr:histidine kinase [Mycetocola sp. JXN-3]
MSAVSAPRPGSLDPAETAAPRGVTDLVRGRRYTAWSLWFVNLSFGLMQLVLADPHTEPQRMLVLSALTIITTALACALVSRVIREMAQVTAPGGVLRPLPIALMVSAIATWVIGASSSVVAWNWALTLTVATGMVLCLVPVAARFWVFLGSVVLLVGIFALGAVIAGRPVDVRATLSDITLLILLSMGLVLLPLTYASLIWSLRVLERMDRARRMASDLAIARERLRFATDLHDIQGHNLQVIALKSELAERLLERDPAAAAAELSAIRTISRAALEDTRAVVNNYRTVTVAVEARGAASVLASAGIDCTVSITEATIPADIGTVLALAIREATTNLLRHAHPTRAAITLAEAGGGFLLTVENDGATGRRQENAGTGLAGLGERAAAIGGTVTGERQNGTFTLTVRVPGSISSAREQS